MTSNAVLRHTNKLVSYLTILEFEEDQNKKNTLGTEQTKVKCNLIQTKLVLPEP